VPEEPPVDVGHGGPVLARHRAQRRVELGQDLATSGHGGRPTRQASLVPSLGS
jgi:hypothetical protein